MAEVNGRLWVGTSGYQYNHWRGPFYPQELPKKQWFEYYAKHFDTVEINNTFYHLPSAETFDHWRAQVPEGFVYSLKYSRYGSHIKRLKDPDQHVPTFLEYAQRLGPALGPILVQLPPNWRINRERLASFIEALPQDQRWAFEFRDPSWLSEAVYDRLRAYNAALCLHDLIEDHPQVVTADWVYLRFHGPGGGSYSHQALTAAARRIQRHLAEGLDVYAYFNNDAEGYAVSNARDLKRYCD